MSEPMSSVEIEDVLSSIRRLVSEDLRPLARSGARAAKKPVTQPEASSAKLILTPALRVVAKAEPAGIELVVASLGAAVAAQGEEWESETGDAEEMQAEPSADWFAFRSGAKTEATSEFETETEARAEVLVAPEVAEAVPGWAQEEVAEDEDSTDAGVLVDDLEPDEAWADEAEARVIAELEDRVVEEVGPDAAAGDDGIAYEEQALRELVRDIIREELQGGLGERITRNIRKLVRAEIGLALATQALE